jgi:tRNA modification GTPase
MPQIEAHNDTIAAIATAIGQGAIGIVRLSGPHAVFIVDQIFLAKNKKSLKNLKTYSCRYGWIVQNKKKSGLEERIIDEVLVLVMRAPSSYTREDVVEIHSHGGSRVLALILERVLESGARLAQPGEFTRRAFLNGRIDLAQAEAVLDIIQAKSDLALKNSQDQLSGNISRKISELKNELLEILADVEAGIDFSEEAAVLNERENVLLRLRRVSGAVKRLLESSFQGRLIREGLKVVIYGRPNVGKSSLLNAILKQERAIVTPVAGTTRDTIEESINIKGLAVRLIDTAGILKYRDAIEKEAIARTKKALKDCDLVLFVFDGSRPLTKEDEVLAKQVQGKKIINIVNKNDKTLKIDLARVRRLCSKEPLLVSARSGAHIGELEEELFNTVFDKGLISTEGLVISNVRHIDILKRAFKSLGMCEDTLNQGYSMEFAALDLKKAVETIGELTGDIRTEEVLDRIFAKFCLGK